MKPTKFPYYLFAIALYPILFLYGNNVEYLQPVDLVRPVVFSLLIVFASYAVLARVLHSSARSAVLTTALWTAYSFYGHVYQAGHDATGALSFLGKHSVLGPLFLLLMVAATGIILKSRSDFGTLASFLNVTLFTLVVLSLGSIVNNSLRLSRTEAQVPTQASNNVSRLAPVPVSLPSGRTKPDVYYIILDTYSRQDVIQKETGLDIAPFLDALKQRGFFVGDHSFSNYDFTRVSLASSLNMDYLPNLDPRFIPDTADNAILDPYILHSRVRNTFESMGYKTVAFATGFSFTEMKDAAEYLAPGTPSLLNPEIQPFESLWMKTTGLRALFDTHPAFLKPVLSYLGFPHAAHVERELFLLKELPEVAQTPGPKFVFAHVLIPHVPLVFRADGSINKDDRYFREMYDQPTGTQFMIDGYRNQVEYINRRLIEIVDGILKNSTEPPVIILQGDHGLLYADHNPILNAYYFPEPAKKALYSSISPVNTFRVLLGSYFGADLPPLPDRAYSSTYTRPYDFKQVTPPEPAR
jgi:hypothetical protein